MITKLSANGYRLELEELKTDGRHLLSFALIREDGAPFKVKGYSLRVLLLSIADMHRTWFDQFHNGDIRYQNAFLPFLRDDLDDYTSANRGMPLVMYTNREGRNRLAAGQRKVS